MKYVLAFLLAAAPAHAQLTVMVNPPAHTPRDASLYIAGNFNKWNPGDPAYRLAADSTARYAITLPDSVRGPIEFKFTLGSWETVEVSGAGEGVANRTFTIPVQGAITHTATVGGWNDPSRTRPRASTRTVSVSILSADFAMPQLDRSRRIWLYLPPDYATSTRTYPVLYMHDGQNVFDDATSFAGEWGVDETLDSLFALGDSGVIVLAIDNGGDRRLDEYSPWVNHRYGGGEGEAYVNFIVHTLKPYIDERYRTRRDRANTAIAGSSMGGLISLYAALRQPDVFGRAGVFSPALWFAPDIFALAAAATPHPDARLYFVSGALESQDREAAGVYVDDQRRMIQALGAAGLSGRAVAGEIRADGTHSEGFWRREFAAAYRWLFHR